MTATPYRSTVQIALRSERDLPLLERLLGDEAFEYPPGRVMLCNDRRFELFTRQ